MTTTPRSRAPLTDHTPTDLTATDQAAAGIAVTGQADTTSLPVQDVTAGDPTVGDPTVGDPTVGDPAGEVPPVVADGPVWSERWQTVDAADMAAVDTLAGVYAAEDAAEADGFRERARAAYITTMRDPGTVEPVTGHPIHVPTITDADLAVLADAAVNMWEAWAGPTGASGLSSNIHYTETVHQVLDPSVDITTPQMFSAYHAAVHGLDPVDAAAELGYDVPTSVSMWQTWATRTAAIDVHAGHDDDTAAGDVAPLPHSTPTRDRDQARDTHDENRPDNHHSADQADYDGTDDGTYAEDTGHVDDGDAWGDD